MSVGHQPHRAVMADEIGRGPLSRAATVVYRMLVLELQLLLAILPTIGAVMLLDRDPSNLPLFVLALLPIVPALVAGVSALRDAARSDDLAPGRYFFRAYRRDLGATLAWAAPASFVLAILTFNLIHLDDVDGGAALRPVVLLLAALIIVWAGHMLVLTAGFRFRARDAARIALAEIVPRWSYSLGVLSLVVVAAFVVLLASEVVLLLVLWAVVGLLALMARPVFHDVTERFTDRR
ncbi:glycosyltransferase [Microbacterium ureisolvens]|uniref:DUF624 domain-containing protein n=1 Tax=Microbacterium ureisolvens TaxID=2781186 RepID=A0ABS7HY61_9MICO|nr:glycosyltransferase [Microbacterium ureisolvens]MBW9110322.1 DUF624 domain-containing protein [Microbacterium ureisolvens]